MHISKIKLTNFKNFSELDLTLINGLNFVVGGNGRGKTNILDAIYNSSFTKSYLHISDIDLVKNSSDFYRIEGIVCSSDIEKKFAVSYQKGKKKKIEFDGQTIVKYSRHIGNIICVMIAPDEQKIVQGGSEERRKLIDNALSQTDSNYLEKIIQYQAILDQRNALLKKMAMDMATELTELLDIYSKQLSELAGFIYQKRLSFLVEIAQYCRDYYLLIADKNEYIDFNYESDLHAGLLYDLLSKNLERDKLLEHTSKGIHRDDIKIEIGQSPLKKIASQGQQKTFIISMKLAICKYLFLKKGDKVILLFDDLFDKLDENRCEKLLVLLMHDDFFTQVLFTDTNKNRIEIILKKIDATRYTKIKFFELGQSSLAEYEFN